MCLYSSLFPPFFYKHYVVFFIVIHIILFYLFFGKSVARRRVRALFFIVKGSKVTMCNKGVTYIHIYIYIWNIFLRDGCAHRNLTICRGSCAVLQQSRACTRFLSFLPKTINSAFNKVSRLMGVNACAS